MEFLGLNRIWQANNTYCYTLPNGIYQTFEKSLDLENIKTVFTNIDYYSTYKEYVKQNRTKFGILDRTKFYPFAMPLNTWIFSNLKNNAKNFIPDYDDFCNFYRDNYCHYDNDKLTFNENACLNKVEFTDIALKVRIGYPFGSFLREFYLRHYLIWYFQKNQIPINVCYSLHDDYYNAVDIILEKDGEFLGVCVLDASSKSKEMKDKKDNNRHKTVKNSIKVENRDGFLYDFDMIPRINFYTDVFGDDVEHLGEINVPNEKQLNVFIGEIEEFFNKKGVEK